MAKKNINNLTYKNKKKWSNPYKNHTTIIHSKIKNTGAMYADIKKTKWLIQKFYKKLTVVSATPPWKLYKNTTIQASSLCTKRIIRSIKHTTRRTPKPLLSSHILCFSLIFLTSLTHKKNPKKLELLKKNWNN